MTKTTVVNSIDKLIILALDVLFTHSHPEFANDYMTMAVSATTIGEISVGEPIIVELSANVYDYNDVINFIPKPIQSYSITLTIEITPNSSEPTQ